MTRKVWYRSSEGSKIEDRGTLTVGDGGFRFEGKKGTIAAEQRTAYFLCSQMLGWVGVLGANKKLAEALSAEIRVAG